MTAGLFHAHGVFFGDCVGPAPMNRKGFFENKWLKRIYSGELHCGDFASAWAGTLKREGFTGGVWGAKAGAERWGQYWHKVPDIEAIVLVYRPRKHIEKSRAKAGFNPSRQSVEYNWNVMQQLHESNLPTFEVNTPKLIDGDYSEVLPVFDRLGLTFSAETARDWIDPDLWHHR